MKQVYYLSIVALLHILFSFILHSALSHCAFRRRKKKLLYVNFICLINFRYTLEGFFNFKKTLKILLGKHKIKQTAAIITLYKESSRL